MHAIAAVAKIFDLIVASLLTFPTLWLHEVQVGNHFGKIQRQ